LNIGFARPREPVQREGSQRRRAHLFVYDGVECPAKGFKADGDASTTVTQNHTSVICCVIARTSVRAGPLDHSHPEAF
jgi:hypothetical protein